MEVVLAVPEAELEEFPEEEDTEESTGQQEQSSKTSQIQGTVNSLLSIITSPTPRLLKRIKRGKLAHLIGNTPEGGSACKAANSKRSLDHYGKRPRLLAVQKHTIKCK